MEKPIYTFPPHKPFSIHFGIAKTLTGTYVCPGWYPVPDGTEMDQIRFDTSALPPKVKEAETKPTSWDIPGSKPGVTYQVKVNDRNDFSCTCPAFSFRRGECKHIKIVKETSDI